MLCQRDSFRQLNFLGDLQNVGNVFPFAISCNQFTFSGAAVVQQVEWAVHERRELAD